MRGQSDVVSAEAKSKNDKLKNLQSYFYFFFFLLKKFTKLFYRAMTFRDRKKKNKPSPNFNLNPNCKV